MVSPHPHRGHRDHPRHGRRHHHHDPPHQVPAPLHTFQRLLADFKH